MVRTPRSHQHSSESDRTDSARRLSIKVGAIEKVKGFDHVAAFSAQAKSAIIGHYCDFRARSAVAVQTKPTVFASTNTGRVVWRI